MATEQTQPALYDLDPTGVAAPEKVTVGKKDKHEEGIVVKTKADVIGEIGPLPVTNTMVGSVLWSVVLIVLLVGASRKMKLVPSKSQLVFESMTQGIYNYVADTLQDEKVTKWAFPLIISLFFVILFFRGLFIQPHLLRYLAKLSIHPTYLQRQEQIVEAM